MIPKGSQEKGHIRTGAGVYPLQLFPSIQPNISRNVTASTQIVFERHKLSQRSAARPEGDRP
jgi:hypothetical protein